MFKNTLKKICDFLIREKLTLSVAESCTGGYISSRLTDVSGASNFIKQNFVTYSNDAKIQFLDVPQDIIEKYGVVSEEVAHDMALGLIRKYGCDVAISTTGILGPTGGNCQTPVGLVYIGFATADIVCVHKYISNKKLRVLIKKDIVNKVFELFYEFLLNNFDKSKIGVK